MHSAFQSCDLQFDFCNLQLASTSMSPVHFQVLTTEARRLRVASGVMIVVGGTGRLGCTLPAVTCGNLTPAWSNCADFDLTMPCYGDYLLGL